MNILTGNQSGTARLSLKDLGVAPKPGSIIADIARAAASPAHPLGTAPAAGYHGLRAPVLASGWATEEIGVVEPLLKDAFSAISGGKGLVKIVELGQSSFKLATTFSHPGSSLHEKVAVIIDVGDDLVSFAKVAFPQFGATPLVQAVGCGLKVGALVVDLVGPSKDPFQLGSAS